MNTSHEWVLPFSSLPQPRQAHKSNFSTETFLFSVFIGELALQDQAVFQVLDRLCKKLDVTRNLRVFYTADLSKNAKPLLIVKPEYLNFIAALLLASAQHHRDLKFLNSVLKMLENGLIAQAESASVLSRRANDLVTELLP